MYKPNPIIIERAIELWRRALAAPVYQNEAPEFATPMTILQGLAAAKIPKNNTPEILAKFGAALSELLTQPAEGGHYPIYLSVDYGPDQILGAAADRAGLRMEFPWKTHMELYVDRVGMAIGYGTPTMYHYPLPDGRWIISRLQDIDVADLAPRIAAGEDVGLHIEG